MKLLDNFMQYEQSCNVVFYYIIYSILTYNKHLPDVMSVFSETNKQRELTIL